MIMMATMLASALTSSSSNLLEYHIPEAIQIQVTKVNDELEMKKEAQPPVLYTGANVDSENVCTFCVDPQITSLSIVNTLVVRAFNLSSEFKLNYYDWKHDTRMPIVCDAELNRAYLEASHPFLDIRLVTIPFAMPVQVVSNTISTPCLPLASTPMRNERSYHAILSEWDVVTSSDVILAQTITKTNNFILNQIEKLKNKAKTFSSPNGGSAATIGSINSWFLAETIFQYIMHTSSEERSNGAELQPLTEPTFHRFLDGEGRILSQRDLRITIYRRGVEPNMRKVIWKHLLNVYPEGYSAQERVDFIKIRCETYRQMKELWQINLTTDKHVSDLANMIRKDVLRTDRQHWFYASPNDGVESTCADNYEFDNENVSRLFNLLLTYALNHRHRYCQGMSDLASPLLFVMKDEAHAYISFCALMKRLGDNFSTDGVPITRKFSHLKALLQHYDLEFYNYLRLNGAHELLFAYRWLLLDLKREFEFEETLQMLEVLWASIPPEPSDAAYLNLFDDNHLYMPNLSPPSSNQNDLEIDESKQQVEQLKDMKLLPIIEMPVVSKAQEVPANLTNHQFDSQDFFASDQLEVAIEAQEDILDRMSKESYSSISDDSSSSCSTNDSGIIGTDVSRLMARLEATNAASPPRQAPARFNEEEEVVVIEDQDSASDRSHSTSIGGDTCKEMATVLVRTFSVDNDSQESAAGSRKRQSPSSFSFARNLLSIRRSVSADSLSSITSGYDGKSIDSKMTNSCAPNGLMMLNGGEIEIEMSELDESGRRKSVSSEQIDCLQEKLSTLNVHGSNNDPSLSNIFSTSTSSLVILSTVNESQLASHDLDPSDKIVNKLLTPDELGPGDAFMLFLCLTLLLQNRDKIIEENMDRNDIQMRFDSMVRGHNVKNVLRDARNLFHTYLSQWHKECLHA